MMGLNEVLYGLKNQKTYKVLLVLILASCLSLSCIAYRDYDYVQADTLPYIGLSANQYVYQVTDMLDSKMEERFFRDSQAIDKLGDYLEELQSNNKFPYLIMNKSVLYLDGELLPREFYYGARAQVIDEQVVVDEWSPTFEQGYLDGGLGLKSVQINESFLAWHPIPIVSGRSFEPSDFIYIKNKPIPVVLGSAYRMFFAIGDVLSGSFLTESLQLEVIGFATENSFLPLSLVPDYVDYRILIPTLRFVGISQTEEEERFKKISYLNMFSGYFPVSDSSFFPEIAEYVTGFCDKYGIFSPTFFNVDNSAVQLMALTGSQWLERVRWLGLVIVVFSMLISVILIQAFTNAHLYRFAILYLLGKRHKQLACYVLGETMILYIIALFLCAAIGSYVLQMPPQSVLTVGAVGLMVLLICTLPSVLQIMRMDFSKHLKEGA